MKNLKRVPLAAIFALFCVLRCFGQDEPIPKPKPKPAAPAAKPTSKAAPNGGPTLLITCDLACVVKVDGERKGRIEADGSLKVHVELGQHILSALTADGPDQLRQDLEIKQTGQTIVHMDLSTVRATRLQQEEAAAGVTWTDSATGLMWTKKDNGSDVNWIDANSYCGNLRLSGHSDWRLATFDELQRMYDPQSNVNGYHVKGNLQLSGWEWSSSQGNASGEAWNFNFTNGERVSTLLGFSNFQRALCVRRSGE